MIITPGRFGLIKSWNSFGIDSTVSNVAPTTWVNLRTAVRWGILCLAILAVSSLANPLKAGDRLRADTVELAVANQEGDTLTTVAAAVSETPLERYLGLSGTDRLDTGTGMWFVYSKADTRTFVMRNMSYPLDIVFVRQGGRISNIISAPVESRPLTRHRGWGRWVLEVNRGWARRHHVSVGDSIIAVNDRGN